MKRTAEKYLKEWKAEPTRKPLILRGARQVGKTYIVREFGKTFDSFIEINFEKFPDVKQIFEREEAFMELSRIQDVSFEKNGILQTFFGYGKLKVQSAGIEQEFIIANVAEVEAVSHRIMELRDGAQHTKTV